MTLTPAKTIELTIESLANSGDGVGRFENKVYFVPFTLPQEKVLIEVTENKKNFARGRLIKIIKASEHRQSAKCEVFSKCGGCDWQHLPYEQQLIWKQKNLQDVLQRIAKLEDLTCIQPIQASPMNWNYRNRIQVHHDSKGFFYYAKSSKKMVYIESCPIGSEAINQWLKTNKDLTSVKSQKIELAEMPDGTVKTFRVDKKGRSSLGFRQVNDAQNVFLNEQIKNHVVKNKITNIIDLYCGQGNWSLNLTKKLIDVQCLGIDNNKVNIDIAKSQAPSSCQFIHGDAIELLSDKSGWSDLVIIDPPRLGCSEAVIQQLNQTPPTWLIYISCHPATMSRDLQKLLASGWKADSIIPVDMFPQTAHLECLTILRSATP